MADKTKTDWAGLLLSLFVPSVIVLALVSAAGQSVSWQYTPGWTWGLCALIPLEGVSAVLTRAAGIQYQEYRGPVWATFSLLGSIVFGAGFVAVMILLPGGGLERFSLQNMTDALSNPWVLQVMLVPLVVMIANTCIGLLTFRGDSRDQEVRLDAEAATAEFWFFCGLFWPVAIGMAVTIVMLRVDSKYGDVILDHLRTIALLYAAFYFVVKAVLFAYLHTARFVRTGRFPIFGDRTHVADVRSAALRGDDLTLRQISKR